MAIEKSVVWKEGTFIAPQHFQQQDRSVQQYTQRYIRAYNSEEGLFGFTSLVINDELLNIGKFAISAAKGFFPDGHYFELDQELILQIAEMSIGATIYLSLPLAIRGSQHFGEVGEQGVREICQFISVLDATSSQQDSMEIEVATDNLTLMLDSEDLSGFTLISVAKILTISDSGKVVLDESFQPAAMQVGASVFLREKNKMVHSLIKHRADQVLQRIQAGQGDKSEQSLMKEYMWLQTLNRWSPWVDVMMADPSYGTYRLYLRLHTLCAELCSLTPETVDDTPVFRVDQLYALFNPLYLKLKGLLSLAFHGSVVTFQWDQSLFSKRRLLRTVVKHPDEMRERRFVLAAQSSQSDLQLAEVLPSAVTLAGNSHIAELVRNAMAGIGISSLTIVPEQLKPMSGFYYFDIDIQHDLWVDMLNKGEMLHLHVDQRIPNLQVLMYAI